MFLILAQWLNCYRRELEHNLWSNYFDLEAAFIIPSHIIVY